MSLSNINNGLVFAASPTLPEYPDNAAGTTYLGRNFTGSGSPLDGWTATGCTLSTSGGNLIVTATASFPRIVRTVTAERTVRFRVRRIAGIATNSRITNTTGTVYENTVLYGTTNTHIHDFYIGAGATGELRIIPGSAGSAAGDVYEISFIYIGDGTYSSRLLDASGNGNHGTVFGATPSPDGGLIYDGINDGTRIPSISTGQLFADAASRWSLLLFASGGSVSASVRSIIGRVSSTAANRILSLVSHTDGTLRCRVRGTETTALGGALSGLTHLSITWDGTTCRFYRAGVFVTNLTVGTAADDNTSLTIGSRDDLAALFFDGTTRDTRIYNRALTEAEITALATNPDAYNLDRVVRSITPVPGSVMTRDINGDTQVGRLESTIATGTAPLTVASTTLVTNLNADRVDSLEGSDFVRRTGTVAQTITGVKTFSAIPILPASDPTTVNQATRKAYIDGKVPGKITISVGAPTGGADGDIWITV